MYIKFLHGLPYRPHSQGVVERVHRIIQKELICYKERMKKNFNIDYALSEVIRIKNNSYNKIIDSTPNITFKRSFNEDEIKIINDRMLKNQKCTFGFSSKIDCQDTTFS